MCDVIRGNFVLKTLSDRTNIVKKEDTMCDVIRGNFVRAALLDRLNMVRKAGREFSYQCIEDYFLDFCEDIGLDCNETPSFYVNNAIVGGSYGYYKEFFETEEDAFKAYKNGDLLFCDYDDETGDLVIVKNF